jgi:hypothetical protein
MFIEVKKWTNLYSPDEDIFIDYHTINSTDIRTLTVTE